MRLRRGKRLPFEALAPYLLELAPAPAPLHWPLVFGNPNPVELEVGFGKGLFLITAAQANPGLNYLGVEIDRGLQLYAATRVAKRRLANVRLVRGDARVLVQHYIAGESLQGIHVYFPDPWWKARHKKRRIFTSEFVAGCAWLLAPEGRLHLATDVREYFDVMVRLLESERRLVPVPHAEPPTTSYGLEYLTNFERKARSQGRQIRWAVYRKQPESKNPASG